MEPVSVTVPVTDLNARPVPVTVTVTGKKYLARSCNGNRRISNPSYSCDRNELLCRSCNVTVTGLLAVLQMSICGREAVGKVHARHSNTALPGFINVPVRHATTSGKTV